LLPHDRQLDLARVATSSTNSICLELDARTLLPVKWVRWDSVHGRQWRVRATTWGRQELKDSRGRSNDRETEDCVEGIWTFPLDIFPRTFPPPGQLPSFLRGVGHSHPSTIRRSTIQSDPPLTCRKLIAVDRLWLVVWVSVASSESFCFNSRGGISLSGREIVRAVKCVRWEMQGKYPTLRSDILFANSKLVSNGWLRV